MQNSMEIYDNLVKEIRDKLGEFKEKGISLSEIEVELSNLTRDTLSKLGAEETIEGKNIICADANKSLFKLRGLLRDYESNYKKKIKIENSIKLLDLDKMLNSSESLVGLIQVLKNNLVVLRDVRAYYPNDTINLYNSLYNIVYKVIKLEFLFNLKSDLLEEVLEDTIDAERLNALVLSDISSLLESASLEPREYQTLYVKYNEYTKDDKYFNSDMILFVVYLQNKNRLKDKVIENFDKIKERISKCSKYLMANFSQVDDDALKSYENSLCEKRKMQKRINNSIAGRVTALALSIVILAGGLNLYYKGVKEKTTDIKYETSIESLVVDQDGKIINRENDSELKELIPQDQLYVVSEYSQLFRGKDENFRFRQDYSFPYTKETSLEDYINIDVNKLKPLNYQPELSDRFNANASNFIREITIYSQDLDNPYVEEYIYEQFCFYVFGGLITYVLTRYCPFMIVPDIRTIKRLLADKNKSKQEYEDFVSKFHETIKKLEIADDDLRNAYKIYDKLIKISKLLNLELPEELERKSYTLRLRDVRKKVNEIE